MDLTTQLYSSFTLYMAAAAEAMFYEFGNARLKFLDNILEHFLNFILLEGLILFIFVYLKSTYLIILGIEPS